MRHATIELTHANMQFSAGHFVIFSSTLRENIHGHTYTVFASLLTEIDDTGLSFDLRDYQEKLATICKQLDLIVLVPSLCKYLSITHDQDYSYIHFHAEKIVFLKRDIKILPLSNITLEELSDWFVQQLLLDKEALLKHRIKEITIKVSSGTDRAGSSTRKVVG
jgi:6-pyruvoyltetrahydropterin/6-carboxytetrahydropterin synthase